MEHTSLVILHEAHLGATTLYVAGSLTIAGAIRLVGTLERLPGGIRVLRLDLRATTVDEEGAREIVELGVRRWQGSRRARTQMVPPAARPSPASARGREGAPRGGRRPANSP